ncbi:MAG: hypothetical protein V2I43_11995, partial [Parvularcula sp.]|nr:hypothetical protein [Parvularcula sp.]
MRTRLEDVLSELPELADAASRDQAEEGLRTLFQRAQGQANSYTAERLDEIYEVAERALALGAAFPPAAELLPQKTTKSRLSQVAELIGRYGGGLLLAGAAPIVAEVSLIFAVACGIGAVLMLSSARRPSGEGLIKLPPPNAPREKFEGLVSAADRTLGSMTA